MEHRRANRAFTRFKKVAWLAVPVIAVGGLFYPWLGFAVIGIMVSLMVMSLFRGKYWCGNFCPHGSMFDTVLVRVSAMRRIPALFRAPALKWGFFVFFMVMFGVRLVGAFGRLGEPGFPDRLGMVFVRQYLIFPTILGVVLALFINPRTWCSFCPMGTIQEVMYRVGTRLGANRSRDTKLAWSDPARCRKCGKCARVCPLELEPYRSLEEGGMDFHRACMRCATCVEHCPTGALRLGSRRSGEPAGRGTTAEREAVRS